MQPVEVIVGGADDETDRVGAGGEEEGEGGLGRGDPGGAEAEALEVLVVVLDGLPGDEDGDEGGVSEDRDDFTDREGRWDPGGELSPPV